MNTNLLIEHLVHLLTSLSKFVYYERFIDRSIRVCTLLYALLTSLLDFVYFVHLNEYLPIDWTLSILIDHLVHFITLCTLY